MKPYANPRKTLIFILVASILMILANVLLPSSGGKSRAIISNSPPHTDSTQSEIMDNSPAENIAPAPGENYGPSASEMNQPALPEKEMDIPVLLDPAGLNMDGKLPALENKAAKIVIIIDDMGMDRIRSRKIIDLKAPLTLAFLPYAPGLLSITSEAAAKGHELLIHVPMEPLNESLDPGPLALRSSMSQEDLKFSLEKMFQSFEGYVGINNHMGSELTANREAMDLVMEELARRDLMFVDSKTIPESVAEQAASDHGLSHAGRDIFLDNVNNKNAVLQNLRKLEMLAHKRGYAIAIGHPRDATIAALEEWLPQLASKNLVLVPVSEVVKHSAVSAISAPREVFGPAPSPARQP